MDFSLSAEQKEIKKYLSELCATDVAPAASGIDINEEFPKNGWRALAWRDVLGLTVPKEFGGQGKDLVTGLMALEEIAAACSSTGMAVGTSAWCAGKAIEKYGSQALKEKYLGDMAKGAAIGAFAVTEAGAGSDVASIVTSAHRDGDSYVIKGGKSYATNMQEAAFVIVSARTGGDDAAPQLSLFLVPADVEGLEIGEPIKTLGLRGAIASRIKLKDCKVPAENLLGEEGAGLKAMLDIIDYTRLNIAAVSIGVARAAYLTGKEYAEKRKVFGKPIGVYQEVAFKISDMYVEMDVSRQLMYHAAWQKEQGMKAGPLVAAAKISATEAAIANSGRAVAIMGAAGLERSNPAERLYRDAKMLETAGGTPDILRMIIAKDMLKD